MRSARGCVSLISRSTSTPTFSGMRWSQMTTSTSCCFASAAASSGLVVENVVYSRSSALSARRMRDSSSIIRMRRGVAGASVIESSRFGRGCAVAIHWQANRERGAFSGRRSHFDGAAVALDDLVHDGKTQPGAFAHGLGREERIEDLRQYVIRDAAAGVGEIQLHLATFGLAGYRQRAIAVDRLCRVRDQVQ